jgi:homoserine dehydrogenase
VAAALTLAKGGLQITRFKGLSEMNAAELWATAGPRGHLRYEATCGAGLPVISTLRALLDSGDEPIEIVGALSARYEGADLRDDVRELVDAMAQRGLLVDAAA